MANGKWSRLAIRLGAPANESALFYRDFVLCWLFVPAGLGLVLFAFEPRNNAAFWVCVLVATVCFVLATKRRFLLATLAGFIAVRFGVGSVLYGSLKMLAAAVVFAVVALAVAYSDRSEYPDDLRRSRQS